MCPSVVVSNKDRCLTFSGRHFPLTGGKEMSSENFDCISKELTYCIFSEDMHKGRRETGSGKRRVLIGSK